MKIECTLQVLLNIAPKASEKPAIKVQTLAVQIYGNASILDRPESNPKKIILVYVKIHPMMIKLLS